MKIKIFSVGKTKESWLEEAIDEYVKRLKNIVDIEFLWVKTDAALLSLVQKEKSILSLDPQGSLYSSEQFSAFLQDQLVQQGARLSLVIGGAQGLPQEIKRKGPLISLSPLTFTHQLTRLILLEQIYRSFEIVKGSNYHK